MIGDGDPTYKEVMVSKEVSKEASKWLQAMMEELKSLYKNETWDLVKLPKCKKAISCK